MNAPKPRDERADEADGGGRATTEQAIGPRARRRPGATMPGIATSEPKHAALPGRQAELVLEVEVEEQRDAEQGEAERGHARQEEVEAPDLAQSLEGDARARSAARRVLGPELLAEHRLHLVAAPPRLADPGRPSTTGTLRTDGSDEDPAPARRARRSRRPRYRRTAGPITRPSELERAVGGEDPRPGRDRIGVHQQRRVDRQRVRTG